MKIGGWWRLYIVFCAGVAVWLTLVYLQHAPSDFKIGEYAASSCGVYRYVPKETAQRYLDVGRVDNSEYPDIEPSAVALTPWCKTDLEKYISGDKLNEARADYRKEIPSMLIGWLAICTLVLAVGGTIGWVWRGFRTNKNPS